MQLPYLILPLCIGYMEGYPDKVVYCRLTPSLITAYHAGYLSDEPEPLITTFVYHDKQVFQLAISVEDLENALRAYWEQLGKKQSIKEKLKIIN